ncbi:MAG: hypothetical protein ILO53_03145 [Clostridia bacterium]|nr:hypothetical protein [Clostridia bacterium]
MLSPQDDSRKKLFSFLFALAAILAVLVCSFIVRGIAYRVPAADAQEKQYFLDDDGEPYLTEMDSYFFFRKAGEMAEEGKINLYNYRSSDALIGQRVYANEDAGGTPLGLSVLCYLIWFCFLRVFGVSLYQTAVWMGPVFGSLAAVPAFLYVKRRAGLAGGIVAGILAGCAIPFVIHTHAGFFDTDMVLAILPLTFLLCQIRSMQESKLAKQIVFALLSAAALVVMSYFWVAFNAYCALSLICTVISVVLISAVPSRFMSGQPWRRKWQMIRGGLLAQGFTYILLFVTGGVAALKRVLSVLDLLRSSSGAGAAALPGAYDFVGEMRRIRKLPGLSPVELVKANTGSVMGMLGGLIPCLLAAAAIPLAILILFLKAKRKGVDASGGEGNGVAELMVDAGFLLPWLVLSLYLAFSSVRYCEIAVLPVCLLCGTAVGCVFSAAGKVGRAGAPFGSYGNASEASGVLSADSGNSRGKSNAHRGISAILRRISGFFRERSDIVIRAAGILLAAAAVIPVIIGAITYSSTVKSSVTDTKSLAMQYVRENTSRDASVAGWWDDGYFTEYASGRRTLTDGGSSSGLLDWLTAKALLTDDLKLSSNIFRMLNESGGDALELIIGQGVDGSEAAELLMELLAADRLTAAVILDGKGLDKSILDKTHPLESNEIVLTLSTDLLGKMRALNYYAFWNPAKGRSEMNAGITVSDGSKVLSEEGRADVTMFRSDAVVHVTVNADGSVSANYSDATGKVYELGRLCVWKDGVLVSDECIESRLTGDGGEVRSYPTGCVLLIEGDRICGLLCPREVCGSVLVRCLVCEDESVGTLELLGTWYGETEAEPCAAQRRLGVYSESTWVTQVWRLRGEVFRSSALGHRAAF